MAGRIQAYNVYCPACGLRNVLRSGERIQCEGCGAFIEMQKDITQGDFKARFNWAGLQRHEEAHDG